jgi:hypothetical protein
MGDKKKGHNMPRHYKSHRAHDEDGTYDQMAHSQSRSDERAGGNAHGSYHGYAVGEGHDSHEGMMNESRTEMSNCPREVIMKPYPRIHGYLPEELDDSIAGADRQMDGDNAQKMRALKPRKA